MRLATSASLELLQFRLDYVDLDPLYSDLLVHRKGLRLVLLAKRLLLLVDSFDLFLNIHALLSDGPSVSVETMKRVPLHLHLLVFELVFSHECFKDL